MHKNASYLWTTPECSRQITDRCWFRSPLLLLKPSLEVWLANSKSWDFFQQLDKASIRTLAAETRGRRDFGWRAKPFFELLFFWLSAPARRLGWTMGLLGCLWLLLFFFLLLPKASLEDIKAGNKSRKIEKRSLQQGGHRQEEELLILQTPSSLSLLSSQPRASWLLKMGYNLDTSRGAVTP